MQVLSNNKIKISANFIKDNNENSSENKENDNEFDKINLNFSTTYTSKRIKKPIILS